MADLKIIIKACKKQQHTAQKQLYDVLADQLYWTCKRYIKDEEDVKEVLADSFFIIFTKINQLKQPEAIYTWAKRITINNCLKRVKKDFPHLYIDDLKTHPATQQVAEAKLEEQQLLKLVDRLPKGCQTIFKLFVIEGYAHKDISQLLEISLGTSKSQLNVAKNKLKTLVNLYYYQNEKNNEKAG